LDFGRGGSQLGLQVFIIKYGIDYSQRLSLTYSLEQLDGNICQTAITGGSYLMHAALSHT